MGHYFLSGVEMKLKHQQYPVLIAATHVPDLYGVKWDKEGVTVGASTTLANLQDILTKATHTQPGALIYCITSIVYLIN